jgi:hypothetical protein
VTIIRIEPRFAFGGIPFRVIIIHGFFSLGILIGFSEVNGIFIGDIPSGKHTKSY